VGTRIGWTRCGRDHLIITFADQPGEAAFQSACALRQVIEAAARDVVRDYAIAPTSALVRFDLRREQSLKEWADSLVREIKSLSRSRRRRQHRQRLRIKYVEREIKRIAAQLELPPEQVTQIHLTATYRVEAVGGFPGSVYLAGLDSRLHVPPPERPNAKIKAGSIGIAGSACFIAAVDQPGAWHVIAQAEEPIFDPRRDPPFVLKPCDLLRFTTAEEAAAKETRN